MKAKSIILVIVIIAVFVGVFFGTANFREGWKMDYGKSEASIQSVEFSDKAGDYSRKKVGVTGKLASITQTPETVVVVLEPNVSAELSPRLKRMAEDLNVGEEITVYGIVKSKDGGFVLSPAAIRGSD